MNELQLLIIQMFALVALVWSFLEIRLKLDRVEFLDFHNKILFEDNRKLYNRNIVLEHQASNA